MIPLTYILLVIIHAVIDWYEIEKKGIYIDHLREAILYALACGAISLVIYVVTDTYGWPLVLFPILTRAAFFSPLLNLFRGKNLFYSGTRSLTEKIQSAIHLPTWAFDIICVAAYFAYLIIYLR